MRKIKIVLPVFLLLLLLCACGAREKTGLDWTALEIGQAVLAATEAPESSRELTEPSDDLLALYGLPADSCRECYVLQGTGAEAFEIAVFRLAEDSDGGAARQALEEYRQDRQGVFTGYAPEQAALAEHGQVLFQGPWLTLLICPQPDAAAEAFFTALDAPAPEHADSPSPTALPEGRIPYQDPKTDDMTLYDTGPILAAWKSGERAGLSEKDRAILTACQELLSEIITDEMSDYEKEWAVYCWLTASVDYDWGHSNPALEMDPDSNNPYGALLHGKAICLGFATTFQLLMDLSGVECITVTGAAFRSSENHAWNMVRLDGAWYCVDATWDISRSGSGSYLYFNVTSDRMAESDHQWDYASVPEAVTEGGGKS